MCMRNDSLRHRWIKYMTIDQIDEVANSLKQRGIEALVMSTGAHELAATIEKRVLDPFKTLSLMNTSNETIFSPDRNAAKSTTAQLLINDSNSQGYKDSQTSQFNFSKQSLSWQNQSCLRQA